MPVINNTDTLLVRGNDGKFIPIAVIKGDPGRGVLSVIRTEGDGSPGSTDVYTITFTDGGTTQFTVYNGRNGGSDIPPEIIADIVKQYFEDNPIDPSEIGAVSADQGAENADRILGIGKDGKVIPVDKPQGDVKTVAGVEPDASGNVPLTASDVGALPSSTKIPAKTSDLSNDSGFITNVADDLVSYYKKSETYTQDEVNDLISAIPKFKISVVSDLPTSDISQTTVYLVKSDDDTNMYTEYIYVNDAWEKLGSQHYAGVYYGSDEPSEEYDVWIEPNGNESEWLTAESIKTALGYTPADEEDVNSLSEEIKDLKENSGGLNKNAVNLLVDILRKATYTEDVSYQITRLSEILGENTDVPDVPEGNSIKLGSVSFENNELKIGVDWDARATLIPIGQYLEKGKTYKFSLGSIAGTYRYGVQVMVADSAGKTFPYTGMAASYSGVSERIIDTGYISNDYTYTPDRDNCILAVNFRKSDNTSLGEDDYTALAENFVFEMTEPYEHGVKKGTVSFENGAMYLSASQSWSIRGTLVPIGRYLEKGKTYKFGLGAIADKYYYGVQIFTAESAGLTFPYVVDTTTYYAGVTARIVDTGWKKIEYTYTPDADNCILAVNFRTSDNASMDEIHYAEIFENFVFEEITQ